MKTYEFVRSHDDCVTSNYSISARLWKGGNGFENVEMQNITILLYFLFGLSNRIVFLIRKKFLIAGGRLVSVSIWSFFVLGGMKLSSIFTVGIS